MTEMPLLLRFAKRYNRGVTLFLPGLDDVPELGDELGEEVVVDRVRPAVYLYRSGTYRVGRDRSRRPIAGITSDPRVSPTVAAAALRWSER